MAPERLTDPVGTLTRLNVADAGTYRQAWGATTLTDGAEYTGDYGRVVSIGDFVAFQRRRFDLFWNDTASVDGGIDGREDGGVRRSLNTLTFETIPCLSEVRAVLRLL